MCAAITSAFKWATSGRLERDALNVVETHAERYPKTLPENGIITLATWNIGYLSGMTNLKPVQAPRWLYARNERLAERFIHEAGVDIAAFQEIDLDSKRSYHVDQVQRLADTMPSHSTAVAVCWDKRYVPFPYWPPSVHFGQVLAAQVVMSRYPILSAERIELLPKRPAAFIYRAFYIERLAQIVRVQVGPHTLVVINIHLEAFHRETRQLQARAVMDLYRERFQGQPVIILGDFNSVPPPAEHRSAFWDEPDADFEGDDTMACFYNAPELREAIPNETYVRDESSTFTFPSGDLSRRLDYIFYTHEHISPVSWHISRVPQDASDHLPVVMRFRIHPASK